jgi:iron-sulfur cluster repair protein YtfE (RIC family)
MFSPDTTVGELAGTFPAAVRVFQRRKVEFCCGMTGDYLPPPNACPTWRALYRALEEHPSPKIAYSSSDYAFSPQFRG